ncbi:MAG: hypothetical protein KC800_01640 [Candidatus Eremiobacteraeota bacterium]|nr:hypothetical protein [Candidatus Eremiobacteraeota bacterium]
MPNFFLLIYAFGAIAFTQIAVSLVPIWFLPSSQPWTTADYVSVLSTQVFAAVIALFFWRKILPTQSQKMWPSVFAGTALLVMGGGFLFFQLTGS